MKKFPVVLLGVCLLVVLAGFGIGHHTSVPASERTNAAIVQHDQQAQARAANRRIIDSAIALLQSGNLVLRAGRGADSYMLSQMNRKDKTFSHCGIVIMEHGYPFVYHSIGGEDNPDQRLRRDSACAFFSPLHNDGLGIVDYGFTTRQQAALQKVVAGYYRARPKFDLRFDLATDDALYCSEFVYKALNKAMGDPAFIQPTRSMGYTFVGIDDLFINPHVRSVCRMTFK